jgi:hypothetical protein
MNSKDRDFLIWLSNRLIYKHGYSYDSCVIQNILGLSNGTIASISDDNLDLIICKYYTDFFLDKEENSTFGYTKEQRENLRQTIKSLVGDVIEHNLPNHNFIIK